MREGFVPADVGSGPLLFLQTARFELFEDSDGRYDLRRVKEVAPQTQRIPWSAVNWVRLCRLPVPRDHPVARSMGPPRAPQRPAGVMVPAAGPLVKRAVVGAPAESPFGRLRWPAFRSDGRTRLL